MCRIKITVADSILLQPPKIVALLFLNETVQYIMYISAFAVHNIAEKTLSCQVQRQQLKKIVTTIFQDYTMFLCFFRGHHQPPAVLHRCRRWNLQSHMLTMLHRIDSHLRMRRPMRGDIDQIDVLPLTHLFPDFLISGVDLCFMSRRGYPSFRRCCFLFSNVTDALDGNTIYPAHALYRRRSPITNPDKT